MAKRLTKEEFEDKARVVHGTRYGYGDFVYVSMHTKSSITCPKHGDFAQIPASHLNGRGCPKCGGNLKLTKEDFETRAYSVHLDTYDYSKFVCNGVGSKSTIICHKHGEFLQNVHDHLSGYGCPFCAPNKKLTLEEFIEKGSFIHCGKYTYPNFEYVNTSTKSSITCPDHGDFLQNSHDHLSGYGCPRCGGSERLTKDQFIIRARKVHGDLYDYVRFEYVNMSTRGIIICPEHGEFSQSPSNHFQGHGCRKCGEFTTDRYIIRAQLIHGDRYDYSKFEYLRALIKSSIICREHGEFRQTPSNHLQGHGCPSCGTSVLKSTLEKFVIKSYAIHGNLYDYSKFDYQGNKTKGIIICPKHGEFQQIPNDHLDGHGCPSCSGLDPKWQREIKEFISFIYIGEMSYNDRTTIKHPITGCFRELDIYLPQIKVAFECNGSYFHDDTKFPGVGQRDQEKKQLCVDAGIDLVVIWENEWLSVDGRMLIENQIRELVNG